MAKGLSRSQRRRATRRRRQVAKRRSAMAADLGLDNESVSSAFYTAGRAVRYGYRIRGPRFPVVTSHQPPEGTEDT